MYSQFVVVKKSYDWAISALPLYDQLSSRSLEFVCKHW